MVLLLLLAVGATLSALCVHRFRTALLRKEKVQRSREGTAEREYDTVQEVEVIDLKRNDAYYGDVEGRGLKMVRNEAYTPIDNFFTEEPEYEEPR